MAHCGVHGIELVMVLAVCHFEICVGQSALLTKVTLFGMDSEHIFPGSDKITRGNHSPIIQEDITINL